MRRGCRGFQDMPLPDWHAVAVHRARCARQRSKASLQDYCPSWDQLDLPRTRPTPVRLHALALRARNSDRIRQSNGGEWHLARAICRARAFGRHAQGSRPCPLCPTICRRGVRRCGGRLLPKSLSWSNIGGTWHIAILSVRSQRPPPLQPSCIVRAGWKGVTSALRPRLFERRIAIAAQPRGIPIRRGGFSLAPLILIAAPQPGQFRSFDNALRPIENLDPIFPFAEHVVPSKGSRAKSADE